MLKKVKMISGSIAASAVLLAGNFAVATAGDPVPIAPKADVNFSLGTIINNILNGMLSIAGLIALVYIILGGFSYLTSSGDPEKVGKATKMMTYAIIGVVIIAVSFALKTFIFKQIFNTDISLQNI